MPGVFFGASSGWVSGPGCRIYAEHGRACDEVELCKEATRSPVQSKQAQAESWPMLVFNSLPLARETRSSPARSLFRALNLVSGSGRSGREGFGSVVARKQSSAHRASDKPILTQWNTDQLRTGRVGPCPLAKVLHGSFLPLVMFMPTPAATHASSDKTANLNKASRQFSLSRLAVLSSSSCLEDYTPSNINTCACNLLGLLRTTAWSLTAFEKAA